MTDGWETAPTRDATTPEGGRTLSDIVLGLWRAKWLMALVFFPIAALGVFLATKMPTEYAAVSRLFVTVGEEYVYRPASSDTVAGTVTDSEQVVQAELEILRSPVVAERVLRRFGLRAVYPDLAEDFATADPIEQETIFQRGVDALMQDFGADAAPRTPIIAVRFSHEDPKRSAEILNALIGAYLNYRSEILITGRPSNYTSQRKRFESDLLDAEAAIREFLTENAIGDFETERLAASTLFASLSDDLFKAEARRQAVAGELASVRNQLATVPAEQDLFVEDASSQTLQALEIEREQLLSRYTPDSTPVREIDKRIAQVRQYIDQERGGGLVRRGPNPLFETLQQRLAGLEGESRSLDGQITALRQQLSGIESRQTALNALQPRYQELLRQRDLMARNVQNFAERELEDENLRERAKVEADNIRIIEPARAPTEGESLKLPVAALAILFAGFSALVAGLFSAFSRNGLGTPRSVQRATGLPVLAVTRRR